MMRTSLSPVLLLVLVAGCSSPPTRYYVLSSVGGSRLAAASGTPALRVDRVRIPGDLDTSQIVTHLDANRVQVSGTSRWAGPLDEMIRRVLSADLAARLPPGRVIDPYQQAGPEVGSLTVDIHQFYADPTCQVRLRAAWQLTEPHAAMLAALEDVLVPPAGKCPDALAATMSQALGRLSDRIAAAVVRSRG